MKVKAVFSVDFDVDIPNEEINKIENIEDIQSKRNAWFKLVSKYSSKGFFDTIILNEAIQPSETHNVEFCAIFDPEKNDVIWED